MEVQYTILIALTTLNLIITNDRIKRKYILPLSFFIIWFYLAFRYNYGIDYLSYMKSFYGYGTSTSELHKMDVEFLFYDSMTLFEKYYQYIIFHTTLLIGTIYYFVRKYVPPRYYALFIFIYMVNPGLMLNQMSALRSSMAMCVFMWSAEFFYIRKTKLYLFTASILIAALFHTSAYLLLITPILIKLRDHLTFNKILVITTLLFIIGSTPLILYIGELITFGPVNYMSYFLNADFAGASIGRYVFKIMVMSPMIFIFYISFKKNLFKSNKLFIIALTYLFIYSIEFDFQQRYTLMLYIYVLATTTICFNKIHYDIIAYSMFCLLIFVTIYIAFINYSLLKSPYYFFTEGNPLWYHSIFELKQFP